MNRNKFSIEFSDNEEAPEEIEHDLIKDSVLEIANIDFTGDLVEDLPAGDIRKTVSDCDYEGKPVSRKAFEDRNWIQKNTQKDLSHSELSDSESYKSGTDDSEKEDVASEEESDENEDVEGSVVGESAEEQSSEDEVDDEEGPEAPEPENFTGINIFSDKVRDVQTDINKGKAIKKQLLIWETLIECRINLQKGLHGCNRLFQKEKFAEFQSQLTQEESELIVKTQKGITNLLDTFIEVQDSILNSSSDYKNFKKGKFNDEELTSSESEMSKNSDEETDGPSPKKKRKKLNDYSEYLEKIENDFKPFKDAVIQKWNDKTRLASGKFGISRFSILDQSTLKQIEQTLYNKSRLIKRTQTKRFKEAILGKELIEKVEGNNDENLDAHQKDKEIEDLDPEIFDDDDFYHKLLKDFIDRKTADVSDPTKLGRQWTQLQKLRSKMKRKVDTRASKGRRLRYTVHQKLVNFMAPIPYSTWDDKVEKDLFRSLFGQASAGMVPLENKLL